MLFKTIAFILLSSHVMITFSGEKIDNHANDLIITGLIIDETLTKGGHDFYDLFNERLNALQLKNNIIVSERNDLSRKIINVSMNDSILFEAILKPQADAIDELVTTAVDSIMEAIIKEDIVSKELQGL
jgi:curli production assembly/transport component CsgE